MSGLTVGLYRVKFSGDGASERAVFPRFLRDTAGEREAKCNFFNACVRVF